MKQAELMRSIEQLLDNLSYINEDLFNQYCDKCYDDNSEPIVEKFTPELLAELEQISYELYDSNLLDL